MKFVRRRLTYSIVLPLLLVACSSEEGSSGAWRVDAQGASPETIVHCEAATIPGTTKVRVALTNRSEQPIHIVKWGTVWDDKVDSFTIADERGPAPYEGLVAIRRGQPPPEDLLELPAGETLAAEVDVRSRYTLENGAVYRISLKNSEVRAQVAGEERVLTLQCGTGIVQRDPSDPSLSEAQQPLHPYAAGCNASQEAGITAMNLMAANATRAAEALVYSGSPIYDRWFGDWTSSRGNKVRGYIQRYNTLDWEVRCGGPACCGGTVVGCVDPEVIGDDRLYVCPPWWNDPDMSLTEFSRVQTLVHEHTHLEGSGLDGTEDIRDEGQCGGDCYGYTNALNLANDVTCVGTSQTCKATRNAENYTFFANDALYGALAAATM